MPTVDVFLKGQIILDRYRIDCRHGCGGQAIGYRGTDRVPASPWETQVFIKQYHDLVHDSLEADAFLEGLQQLKKYLRDLDTRVVLPLALGRDQNSLVCIFRFIDGLTFEKWLRHGFDDVFMPRIAISLAHTTDRMHKSGIAHLDLKPSNIMLNYDERRGKIYMYFVDLDASSIYGKRLRERILRTYLYYAPEFEAPELLGSIGLKSDVFSLGIMLYILLFSRHPFAGSDNYKTAVIHGRFEVPPSNYHREVIEEIINCLDPKPSNRPTAGIVSRCLNIHAPNGFKALTAADRHQGRALPSKTTAIFRLEKTENGLRTMRIYEDDQIIGRVELNGMLLSDQAAGLPSQILRVSFGQNVCISVISEEVDVSIDGSPVSGKHILPSGKYCLTLDIYNFDIFVE